MIEIVLRYKVIFLLSFCLWGDAHATVVRTDSDLNRQRNEQSPINAGDLIFLTKEPSRKQKQLVETDGIRTKGDALVLESAVVDVLRFCGGLSLWQYSGYYERVMSRVTKRGAQVLEWPPKHGRDKIVPLSPMRYSGWKIVSNSDLSVRVDYGDMGVNGGLKWPPIVSWRMVFLREDGMWKFDRYEE